MKDISDIFNLSLTHNIIQRKKEQFSLLLFPSQSVTWACYSFPFLLKNCEKHQKREIHIF